MKSLLIFPFLLFLKGTSFYAQELSKDLYVFDFGLNSFSIAERTKFISDLGYKGLTFAVSNNNQLDKLKNYIDTEEFKTGKLSIPAVYYNYRFGDDANVGSNPRWKRLMNEIPEETSFWVFFTRAEQGSPEEAKEALKLICAEAKKLNKDVVIYPHDRLLIESAEEAVTYIEDLNLDNLYTTIHLCHELRDGNAGRIEQVIDNVAPYLKYVSISGALNEIQFNPPQGFWEDVIRPLDDSEYDLQFYVSQLQRIGYTGEVFLHTFGIDRAPENHLSASIGVWEELVDNARLLHIDEQSKTASTIFPNPFQSEITFSLENFRNQPVHIEIFNEIGQIVYSTKDVFSSNVRIHLDHVSSGVYVAKIDSNAKSRTFKILKN